MKKILLFLSFSFLFATNLLASAELVLNSTPAFEPTYQNRFSFMLGLNPSLTKSTDITNYAFSYGTKMDDYWLDTNFSSTSGLFNKLTTNNPLATTLTDDSLVDTTSSHTTIGIGVARETNYAQTLLPFSDIFELMAANITYNLFKEPISSQTFSGPGMIAKLLVYKRFSEYFSAGAQFTYNLAVVKRSQEFETESSSARSLTLSYMTIGFDLSFFL